MHEVNLVTMSLKRLSEKSSASFTTDKPSKICSTTNFVNRAGHQRSSRHSDNQSMPSKNILSQKSYSYTNVQQKSIKKVNNDAIKPCYCLDCAPLDDKKQLIQEAEDHLQKLLIELINEKNQNQMLRREVYIARKVVEREVGNNIISFETLLEKSNDEGWMGRYEMCLILRRKIRDLTTLIENLEGEGCVPPPKWKPRKKESTETFPDERIIYWTLELERREVLKNAERDRNVLMASKVFMKEKLEPLIKKYFILIIRNQ